MRTRTRLGSLAAQLTPGCTLLQSNRLWSYSGRSAGFGDSLRNCLIGPLEKNVDFTIGKVFRITDRQSVRFRTDFFNLTNHPSFANTLKNYVQSPALRPSRKWWARRGRCNFH